MRFDGLENDITYTKYNMIRKYVVNCLNDDEKDLDVRYLSIMLDILQNSRETLDKIKEYRDGRTETEDSNTET